MTRFLLGVLTLLCLVTALAASENPLAPPPLGGANRPELAPPLPLVISLAELPLGDSALRVPTGSYEAPAGGAALYTVPGPIVSFRGADGQWRGHSYLETYPRLLSFTGTVDESSAELDYRFEGDARYQVTLRVVDGRLEMHERSSLGPRNCWVFDSVYGWEASAALVSPLDGSAFTVRYMPGHYDRPELTLRPARLLAESMATEADPEARPQPGAFALLAASPAEADMFAMTMRDLEAWQGADQMGIQVWQRRQLPGNPASRHFQAPETKSDSTPNPRTAALLGTSPWEAHNTIELALGRGERHLTVTVLPRPPELENLARPFLTFVAEEAKR
jgi:hypothetical protein